MSFRAGYALVGATWMAGAGRMSYLYVFVILLFSTLYYYYYYCCCCYDYNIHLYITMYVLLSLHIVYTMYYCYYYHYHYQQYHCSNYIHLYNTIDITIHNITCKDDCDDDDDDGDDYDDHHHYHHHRYFKLHPQLLCHGAAFHLIFFVRSKVEPPSRNTFQRPQKAMQWQWGKWRSSFRWMPTNRFAIPPQPHHRCLDMYLKATWIWMQAVAITSMRHLMLPTACRAVGSWWRVHQTHCWSYLLAG